MSTSKEYVSIHCNIHVAIKRLEIDCVNELADTFQKRSNQLGIYSQIEYLKGKLDPKLRKIRQRDPDIAEWIDFMESSIASLALQMSDSIADSIETTPQRVSLSANNLELTTKTELQVGDCVEVVIALFPSRIRMLVIGEVGSVKLAHHGFLTSVGFRFIREADQEILIRHIHQTQLEELQQARRSNSDQGSQDL